MLCAISLFSFTFLCAHTFTDIFSFILTYCIQNLITRGEAQLGALKKNALATTTTTTTTTRRAALGDLVANRARGLAETKKANAISIEKSTVASAAVGLKNVKPRVDTHWANEPIRRTTTRTNSILRSSGTAAYIPSILTTGPKLVSLHVCVHISIIFCCCCRCSIFAYLLQCERVLYLLDIFVSRSSYGDGLFVMCLK